MQIGSSGDISIPSSFAHNLELEIAYADLGDSGVDIDLSAFFLNYRGESHGLGFVPYFGAGVGLANLSVKAWPLSDDDTVFAAQAFAGVHYNFTPQSSIALGARYIWTDDARIAGFKIDSTDDVAIEASFTFRF